MKQFDLETQDWEDTPPRPTPLEFLEAVYCNEGLPLHTRLKAAIEAAQYRHPKLGAIATTSMNGNDFASLLERAIERSSRGQEPKLIEHREREEG